MPMQPSPRVEATGPCFPNLRVFIIRRHFSQGLTPRNYAGHSDSQANIPLSLTASLKSIFGIQDPRTGFLTAGEMRSAPDRVRRLLQRQTAEAVFVSPAWVCFTVRL